MDHNCGSVSVGKNPEAMPDDPAPSVKVDHQAELAAMESDKEPELTII